MERYDVDAVETAERADHGSDLPGPGEEDEDIPRVTLERMMHRCGDTVFQTDVGSPGHPPQIDRERPSAARHDWRIPEEDRDRARVESRRHDEDAKVRAEAFADVERECQAEIRLEVSFMELVEDDERDTVEGGVPLEASGENAVGDDLDPGLLRDPALVTRRDADGLPDTLAEQCGHPRGGSACGDPTGFEQEHATAIHPRFGQQPEGYDRRLAGARLSLEDRGADPEERGTEFVDDLFDRKAGPSRVGDSGHRPGYGSYLLANADRRDLDPASQPD
jgi:hypothetical protein